MAAVMQSSDALPREAAARAKTCGFTLLSPLTPKDRCHRLTMAAVMQSSSDPVANNNSSPPAKQLATTGNTVTFQGSGAADS